MTEEAKQRIHNRTLEMRQEIIESHTDMLEYIENYIENWEAPDEDDEDYRDEDEDGPF